MRLRTRGVAVLACCCLSGAVASAQDVADFQSDYLAQSADGTPAPGWSYLWNGDGAINDFGAYDPLVFAADRYVAASGNSGLLAVGAGAPDPALFPSNPPVNPFSPDPTNPQFLSTPLPQTYVRPGPGAAEPAAGGVERAAVVAYEFAQAGTYAITDYYFAVSGSLGDPATADDDALMSARVFAESKPLTPLQEYFFPRGFAFATELDPDPIALGTFAAGERVFVVIGGVAQDGRDELRMDFTLTQVPEPAGAAIAGAVAAFGLLTRRRRGA